MAATWGGSYKTWSLRGWAHFPSRVSRAFHRFGTRGRAFTSHGRAVSFSPLAAALEQIGAAVSSDGRGDCFFAGATPRPSVFSGESMEVRLAHRRDA